MGEEKESRDKSKIPKRAQLDAKTLRLLKLRRLLSQKRPRFIRMNSWYLIRLGDKWRSPRHSLDNKIRRQKKGFPAMVKVGYRGPRMVRDLHPSGFEEVMVYNVKDLDRIDPTKQAARIASTVGRRKRLEIIKKAEELGIRVLNAGAGV